MIKKIISLSVLLLSSSVFIFAQKLSKATTDIIGNIKGSIEIKCYISDNLPDSLENTKDMLEDLLKYYSKESKGRVLYSFVNPDKATKREYFFFQENFSPFEVVEESKNFYRKVNVYSGAIMYYGSNIIILPSLVSNMPLEYILSKNIKRLLNQEKKQIGLIYGHGEPNITSFKEISKDYENLFDFKAVDLTFKPDLSGFDAIMLVSPRELIDENHFEQLNNYVHKGGNVFVAVDRVNVSSRTKQGVSLITGVGQWLEEMGIIIEKKFVIDENCGLVMVDHGAFKMPVSLPYLPSIESFKDHPVTNDLSRLVLRFPSPVSYDNTKNIEFYSLIESSPRAQTYNSPLLIDYNRIWNTRDYTESNITLAGAIKVNLTPDRQARLIVISDGDFLLNEQRDYSEDSDNLKFMFNALEWLTDDTGLMDLKK